MANKREALIPDKIYHFYNHAVGSDNLFQNCENYVFFLRKYNEYLFPIFETFAYCLLPNHFHFLVQIRDEDSLKKELLKEAFEDPKGFEKPLGSVAENEGFSNLIAHRVGSFQNSYAKAFNKQQKRNGGLFRQSFGRKMVGNDNYFTNVIHYIHTNAVHHKFVNNLIDWDFSSYHSYLCLDKSSRLNRKDVLDWFSGQENMIKFHQNAIEEKLIEFMEDFD
jgi:REP element-mobilizing transposase RayT